jgi:hypothetical protein
MGVSLKNMKLNVNNLREKWVRFKKLRSLNPTFKNNDNRFITVIKREKIIDLLFNEIQRIKNA